MFFRFVFVAGLLSAPVRALSPSAVFDFEDGTIPAAMIQKLPKPHNLTIQKEIVRKGKYAARFELRKGDLFFNPNLPSAGGPRPDGYRAELMEAFTATPGETYWYAISLFIPEGFPKHLNRLVLGQWNAVADSEAELKAERSPPLSQRYIDGKFVIKLRHDRKRTQKGNGKELALFKTADLPLGKWNDLIYQVKWSWRKDGLVRAWLNGNQIADYKGPVGYNDKQGPYFKFGIYRDDVPETYVVYFDEYRRGRSRDDVELAK